MASPGPSAYAYICADRRATPKRRYRSQPQNTPIAKALGLEIPQTLLARADEVIE